MSVYANSRAILHKGDGNTHVAAPPDVCKTPSPGGPVPIPYVNTASDSNLSKGTKKVKIEGNPAAKADSELSTSMGDEPGTAGGGVVSSKFKGKLTWSASSSDVKLEGKGAVRFMDPTGQNANTFNTAFISTGTTGQAYGDDIPCALCGKVHPLLESTGAKDAVLHLFLTYDDLLGEKKHDNPFRAEEQHYCDVEDVKKEIKELDTEIDKLPALLAAGSSLATKQSTNEAEYGLILKDLGKIEVQVSRAAAEARMRKRQKIADQFPDDAKVSQAQLLLAALGLLAKETGEGASVAREAADDAAAKIQEKYKTSEIEKKLPVPDMKSAIDKKAAGTAKGLIMTLQQAFQTTVRTVVDTLKFIPKYANQAPPLQVIRRTLDKITPYLEAATESDGLAVRGKMMGVVLCNSEKNEKRRAVFACSGQVAGAAVSEIKDTLKKVLQKKDPDLVPRHEFEAATASLQTRTAKYHEEQVSKASSARNKADTELGSAIKNKAENVESLSGIAKKAKEDLDKKKLARDDDLKRLAATKEGKEASTAEWGCAAPKMSGKLTETGHNPLFVSEVFYSPLIDQKVAVRDVITVKKKDRSPAEESHFKRGPGLSAMVSETSDTVTIAPPTSEKSAGYSQFGHGETVPSCDQCQKWLPAYFCEKDKHCCA